MGTAVDSGQSLLLQRDDSGGVYSTLPITLAKGRPPKEALQNQKTIRFEVRSLEEFETALREHLESNPEHPEHILARFNFWTGASFLVSPPQDITLRQQQHLGNAPLPTPPLEGQAQQPQQQQHHQNAPPGYQPATAFGAPQYGGTQMNTPQGYHSVAPTAPPSDSPPNPPQQQPSDKTNMTIDSVLIPTLVRDDRPTKNRQLVFAKALIAAVQRADGFRYSFHNSWYSGRDHRAFGFSYYCNDSFLNKDRAANGKGTKVGKRATKPVFPCGGLVRVLFSAVEKTLVLEYRHNPCHKTYAERAPPARPNSKRRRVGEGETGAAGADGNAGSSTNDGAVHPRPPKKKKRKENGPLVSVESELLAQSRESMLGLILTDPLPGMETMRSHDSVHSGQANGGGNGMAGSENGNGTVPGQEQAPTRLKPPKKARKSCDMCHTKRAKCDAVRPTCSTCREKGRRCIYPPDDGQQAGAEQEQSEDSAAVIAELRRKLADMEEKFAEAQAQIRELQAKERERERTNSSSMGPPVQAVAAVQTQPQPQTQTRMQPQMQPPRRQSHGRPTHVHYQPQTQSPLQAQPPSLQEQLQSHLQQDQSQSHAQSQAPSYIQQPQAYSQSQPQTQYQSQPPSQYQGQPPSHYPVQQAHSLPAAPYRHAHPQQAQQTQPSPWVFYQ